MPVPYPYFQIGERVIYVNRLGSVVLAYFEDEALCPPCAVPVIFDDEPRVTYLIRAHNLKKRPSTL